MIGLEQHNDNDGYVSGKDPTPQAFSHFSWEASNHQLLVCDIQVPILSKRLSTPHKLFLTLPRTLLPT